MKKKKKTATKVKKGRVRARTARQPLLAPARNQLLEPVSGLSYDIPDGKVHVRCQLATPQYTAARARFFRPGDPVTVATGDVTDGYTTLEREDENLPYFSAYVDVVVVNPGEAPAANNNKVMVWAFDDDSESDSWDPVGIVYLKVFDSSIIVG